MINKYLKNFDWILFSVVILLFSLGILTVYSATFSISGGENKALSQLMFGAIGLFFFFILTRVDYRLFKRYSGLIYVIMLLLLLAVDLFGTQVLGARRWIDLGFFRLQPSEIAKVFSILCLAKYFAEHNEEMWKIRHILISAIYILIPVIMVIMEPDLGTAIILFLIWAGMLFVSNIKRSTLLKIFLIILAMLPLMWFTLHDYQRNRISTLFSGSASDPLDKGWNVEQALIAIGSGQVYGRGMGYGPQSHLNFLPMQHTDFAFAVLAEEMGFLGAVILLMLFAVLLYRMIIIAKLSRDTFGMFIASGTAVMFFAHVFINIGMNIRIMPVTGIPLPFISAGGTAIIVNLIAVGLLESIYIRHKKIDF
ncbi:rod shape-determining protein RodA [bacterium CG2_30_37_16]|nr:MAG: rod shape-determining protein RodA [bacterium CG2_30_37_16]PIP30848.1 MAG: rod shape-determining protein RodA [bacterium (Candidatus Howlettbacteria) CG23_combo_of_CG06-09_8_20_14_all_37_9]PIX99968.1 MAG: rod shape-determining protein RodA [bacterium (Candidatus Howlettbacteria) CG_4_10_14_3_um_filter_37_10]PJB07204.1 MAG: rod shape-determining protein RodA [bacterium (Candidatus Howlettbacteria) CG_4_9_14_3_um_filter_37_10]